MNEFYGPREGSTIGNHHRSIRLQLNGVVVNSVDNGEGWKMVTLVYGSISISLIQIRR